MLGREFKPGQDFFFGFGTFRITGSARESVQAGYRKPVGRFPFVTRNIPISEEAYDGFSPEVWYEEHNSREFLAALRKLR